MISIEELISEVNRNGGSDLHLVRGLPPKYRKDGRLLNLGEIPLTEEACEEYARELAGVRYETIKEIGELDLARSFGSVRVRVNLFRQQGTVSSAIRLLKEEIPQLSTLGLPPAAMELPGKRHGIVLVTGETGSGKSTTLAAILQEINRTREAHIVTLEDPVEYIYKPDKCIINQREIGRDTVSYGHGLKAVLREDPDIILIGEMRDLDTIETALTAAETGHLVFGTLHTNSAAESVDRIAGVFPEQMQRQIQMQLSTSLLAVLSQQLVLEKSGRGRVLACEMMVVTPAIRNLIREGKTPQIANAIATSAAEGSITMDNFLLSLWKRQAISAATVREAARDLEFVKRKLLT
ncbi:MAG: PilT/PilU family type 4a pilus ATPase [Clostridium sp.]|nr:PilT/PilU family type 4a pilus ATPase [Clostridium sp.]